MHPVNGDELLGHRVRRGVVVRRRARDPADDFAATQAAQQLVQPLALQSPPVPPHRHFGGRVADDCRSPLEGMDLGHERGVDQSRLVKQILVGPRRVLGLEPVADGVVLQPEQREHHRQADPPARDAADLDQVRGRDVDQAVRTDSHLPVCSRPYHPVEELVAPVDLGAVPPVGLGVEERRGRASRIRRASRVAADALDPHGAFVPGIIRIERDPPVILPLVSAVAEPVPSRILEPGRRQDIECRGWLEGVARE